MARFAVSVRAYKGHVDSDVTAAAEEETEFPKEANVAAGSFAE
jgi:hypothetical protein